MKSRLGPGKVDPIMQDIIEAAKAGHFDRRRAEGPSQLESTSVFELYPKVTMMAPARYWIYLCEIGRIRHRRTRLAGEKEMAPSRSKKWLSR